MERLLFAKGLPSSQYQFVVLCSIGLVLLSFTSTVAVVLLAINFGLWEPWKGLVVTMMTSLSVSFMMVKMYARLSFLRSLAVAGGCVLSVLGILLIALPSLSIPILVLGLWATIRNFSVGPS